MLTTVEAYYHDGKIDLKELPKGIKEAKIIITFLDNQQNDEIPNINWKKIVTDHSKVDKWIGILSHTNSVEIENIRKEYIEKKHK